MDRPCAKWKMPVGAKMSPKLTASSANRLPSTIPSARSWGSADSEVMDARHSARAVELDRSVGIDRGDRDRLTIAHLDHDPGLGDRAVLIKDHCVAVHRVERDPVGDCLLHLL